MKLAISMETLSIVSKLCILWIEINNWNFLLSHSELMFTFLLHGLRWYFIFTKALPLAFSSFQWWCVICFAIILQYFNTASRIVLLYLKRILFFSYCITKQNLFTYAISNTWWGWKWNLEKWLLNLYQFRRTLQFTEYQTQCLRSWLRVKTLYMKSEKVIYRKKGSSWPACLLTPAMISRQSLPSYHGGNFIGLIFPGELQWWQGRFWEQQSSSDGSWVCCATNCYSTCWYSNLDCNECSQM